MLKRVGAVADRYCVTISLVSLELFLVGNASIGEPHNFVDRYLSTQSIEDVLTPPVLHEMDVLRAFGDQCSPPAKGDQSIDSPGEICN